jgi:DNA-binding PadR family transcriptional regulator
MHPRIRHFLGRHHSGHGLARFGKGFMDGGRGRRVFGMGRKLASVDLQLLILALLADEPHHGYRIIKALDERSNGFYVPSPGMVYPALTYLEEFGHASVQTDRNRKRYHISDAGRRHLEQNRGAADALFAQFQRVADQIERVRRVLDSQESGDEPERGSQRRGSRDLLRARREFESALADKWDGSREERQRIVEILQRAAADIAGKEPRR